MTLLFATLLHPLVDACSATVLVAGGFSWKRALVYNIIAFALQLPLGVVLDACPTLLKPAFATGIASTLGGIFACLCGFAGWGPLVAVCAGNALFHLTAGKSILDTWPDRSAPSGVFIATGALGLFAGLQFGGKHTVWCAAGFGVALTLAALCAWFKGPFRTTEATYLRIRGWLGPGILTGLFPLVVWRSWAGFLRGCRQTPPDSRSLAQGWSRHGRVKRRAGILPTRSGGRRQCWRVPPVRSRFASAADLNRHTPGSLSSLWRNSPRDRCFHGCMMQRGAPAGRRSA
ncbi:MAG: hypothetical protein J6Z49_00645 [Kiritimatiellae bacterium]|nr:hypothetical protein [Kiritimatiellia bacterium]